MKIETFRQKLERLDLQLVANKLMSSEYGSGWTVEETKLALERYKKFLMLQYLYPNLELVPTKEIDAVWHEHILVDTHKYVQDCQYLFGYFLHHCWSDKKTDILENKKLGTAFLLTKELFMEIFGEDILGTTTFETAPCTDLPVSPDYSLEIGACTSLPKKSFSYNYFPLLPSLLNFNSQALLLNL